MIWPVMFVALQALVPFATLARGPDSQITEPRQVVVRAADEWRALWKEHDAGVPPAVDFATSMVVGVFLGSRPTAGYEVDIVAIRPAGAGLVVEYRERRPPPGALAAQVLTAPFHLVRLARIAGPVDFTRVQP